MRIDELVPDCSITFYVKIGGEQQLIFESSIIDVNPKKKLVLAEAILKDGKVLAFKGNAISVDMVAALPEGKPFYFQNISVEPLRLADNSFCYNLSCAKEGVPYNRRGSYRCFIGNPVFLRNSKEMKEYSVILRDVSVTGFSITCGEEVDLELGPNQMVHVLLEDYLEEIDQNFTFHLYGLMVRRQEMENNKVLYGFKLNSSVSGLENYLTQKERLRIKRNRGN